MPVNTVGLAPGVYIDEFEPTQPIAGVATNVAAFIGVAGAGPVKTVTRIQSWDQFRRTFGDVPVDDTYLWYAVRGFYRNGGTNCYIVRTDGSTPSTLPLQNATNVPSWTARTRETGAATTSVALELKNSSRLKAADTHAFKPSGTIATPPTATDKRLFKLTSSADATKFRAGDRVLIGPDTLTIARVLGTEVTVTTDPPGAHAAGETITLSPFATTDKTIRLESTATNVGDVLVPGSILTLKQGPTVATGIVRNMQTEFYDLTANPAKVSYRVTFRDPLAVTFDLANATAVTVESAEFSIGVIAPDGTRTDYTNLSLDAAHPRYFINRINDDINGLIMIDWVSPRPATALPGRLPKDVSPPAPLAGGSSSPPTQGDFTSAIDLLQRIDDVNLLACPDAVMFAKDPGDATGSGILQSIQIAMINHCESMGDRFAILDARPGAELSGSVTIDAQRALLGSDKGYAALYFPWVTVMPTAGNLPLAVPPSGHVCGLIARSDDTRGVFKAPANEQVREAIGVEHLMSDVEQGTRNEVGINCIRLFSNDTPRLWGARTISNDTNWRYVSTRRLFLYLEKSIQRGIRWAVFEPNNQTLWKKLRRSITDFLMRAYRDGALFGDKPEQAFYVRIDEDLNPFSERQLGRLTLEIGINPAFPAEFIIVRIGIWAGGSDVTES